MNYNAYPITGCMVISAEEMISFGIALIIGIAVGIERSYRASKEEEMKGAGIRTFALSSILGFLMVSLFKNQVWTLTFILGIFSFLFILIPIFRKKEESLGLTTSVSILVVLLTGMVASLGYPLYSLIIGSFVLILNSSKKILHRFVKILSYDDLISAVRFLIVAVILIPILYTLDPIHPVIGRGKVFDPFQALMMVLFVSSISFLSYLSMKKFGSKKGLKVSAFIGGFVSSAAATASVSEKCEKLSSGIIDSAKGIYLSNISMFIKDFVILLTVGGVSLAYDLTLPLGLLLIMNLSFVFKSKKEKDQKKEGKLDLGSPFAIIPAVKFAFLFSLIWVSSYLLQNYVGGFGVYLVSLGGLLSTTSVSASVSSLYATGDVGALTAISTLLLAFGFGSISKVLIARTYQKNLSRNILFPMFLLTTTSFILVVLLN